MTKLNASTWLAQLPTRIADLAQRWNLEVQAAYPDCGYAFVAPVRKQGQPGVLKVQWPHPESEHEAEALRRWGGQGAVQLLAAAPEHHALLLQQCIPGDYLTNSLVENPMDIIVELLPQLSIPAGAPFQTLKDEALGWQAGLHRAWENSGKQCDKLLVDTAFGLVDELAYSQGEQVLVHQDLHGHNILKAADDQWLAIDPKPLVGERAFALSPILRSLEFGANRADLAHRFDQLTERLAVDRQRARGWATVQSIAWSFGSEASAAQQQTARWLLDL